MPMRCLALSAALMVLAASPAVAADFPPYSTKRVFDQCIQAEKFFDDAYNASEVWPPSVWTARVDAQGCVARISGLSEGIAAAIGFMTASGVEKNLAASAYPTQFGCAVGGSTTEMQVRIFVQYAKRHPELFPDLWSITFSKAMQEKFPCDGRQ